MYLSNKVSCALLIAAMLSLSAFQIKVAAQTIDPDLVLNNPNETNPHRLRLAKMLDYMGKSWNISGTVTIEKRQRGDGTFKYVATVSDNMTCTLLQPVTHTIYYNSVNNVISEVYIPRIISHNPPGESALMLLRNAHPPGCEQYILPPPPPPEPGSIFFDSENKYWVELPSTSFDSNDSLYKVIGRPSPLSPGLCEHFVRPDTTALDLGVYFNSEGKASQVKLPFLRRREIMDQKFTLKEVEEDTSYINQYYFYQPMGLKNFACMKITYHYDKKNLNTIGSIDFGSMQDFRKGYEEALRMKGLTDSVSLNVVLRAMLIIDPKPPVPVRLVISDDAKGDLITTDKLLGIKPKQVCTLPEMSLEEPIDSLHTNLYNYAMEIVWQDYAHHTQVTFPSTQAQCKSLIIQRMNPEKIGLPAIWWAGLGFSSCLIITLMLL